MGLEFNKTPIPNLMDGINKVSEQASQLQANVQNTVDSIGDAFEEQMASIGDALNYWGKDISTSIDETINSVKTGGKFEYDPTGSGTYRITYEENDGKRVELYDADGNKIGECFVCDGMCEYTDGNGTYTFNMSYDSDSVYKNTYTDSDGKTYSFDSREKTYTVEKDGVVSTYSQNGTLLSSVVDDTVEYTYKDGECVKISGNTWSVSLNSDGTRNDWTSGLVKSYNELANMDLTDGNNYIVDGSNADYYKSEAEKFDSLRKNYGVTQSGLK